MAQSAYSTGLGVAFYILSLFCPAAFEVFKRSRHHSVASAIPSCFQKAGPTPGSEKGSLSELTHEGKTDTA